MSFWTLCVKKIGLSFMFRLMLGLDGRNGNEYILLYTYTIV